MTIFANPVCITAWRAEAQRIALQALSTHNAHHIHNALSLLDELYCLKNPANKNPLYMRQAAFSMFTEASMAGYPLAMFFEGLARKEGFGCKIDTVTGQALIRVASIRKCAEALNYLALCYCKQDLVIAFKLLNQAALNGHVSAQSNVQQLKEHIRIQVRRKRRVIDLSTQTNRFKTARLSL